MELPRLRGSFVTLKGHLTHMLDQCNKFLMDPVGELTQGMIISFEDEISKRHGVLEDAVFTVSGLSL